MGDMADMEMSNVVDMLDESVFDDPDCDLWEPTKISGKPVTCKYCQKENLHWDIQAQDHKWRLFDACNNIHLCQAYYISRIPTMIKSGPTTFMRLNKYPLLD